jgi:hypothetical protein
MKPLAKHALLLAFGLALAAGSAELLVRIAAAMSFNVKYLATAGIAHTPAFTSLEDFVGIIGPELAPHRVVGNYYTNGLGFADKEFSVEKRAGTLRIMGIGDSFTFGSVSYPRNVITLVQDSLNRDCADTPIEIMNFGIPSAGVSEYRAVHVLAAPRYKPDRVVVHFYLGNDGPDLVSGNRAMPEMRPQAGAWSYAWSYVKNSITVLRSLERGTRATSGNAPNPNARGGERASDLPDLTDAEIEPSFTPEAFDRVLMDEVQHLYRGRSLPFRDRWKDTLEVLDTLRSDVAATTGRPLIIVLYPSQAQIYPALFEETKQKIKKFAPAVDLDDFDAAFPNEIVLNFCRRAGLVCEDITSALLSAARESMDPLYKPRDTHWNVRGNRVAAAAEAAFLRPLLCTNH